MVNNLNNSLSTKLASLQNKIDNMNYDDRIAVFESDSLNPLKS
jgi:hypothetical protein